MPLIKQKPSINPKWVKGVTKQQLIDMHPLADEKHLSDEYDKLVGTEAVDKPAKKVKK